LAMGKEAKVPKEEKEKKEKKAKKDANAEKAPKEEKAVKEGKEKKEKKSKKEKDEKKDEAPPSSNEELNALVADAAEPPEDEENEPAMDVSASSAQEAETSGEKKRSLSPPSAINELSPKKGKTEEQASASFMDVVDSFIAGDVAPESPPATGAPNSPPLIATPASPPGTGEWGTPKSPQASWPEKTDDPAAAASSLGPVATTPKDDDAKAEKPIEEETQADADTKEKSLADDATAGDAWKDDKGWSGGAWDGKKDEGNDWNAKADESGAGQAEEEEKDDEVKTSIGWEDAALLLENEGKFKRWLEQMTGSSAEVAEDGGVKLRTEEGVESEAGPWTKTWTKEVLDAFVAMRGGQTLELSPFLPKPWAAANPLKSAIDVPEECKGFVMGKGGSRLLDLFKELEVIAVMATGEEEAEKKEGKDEEESEQLPLAVNEQAEGKFGNSWFEVTVLEMEEETIKVKWKFDDSEAQVAKDEVRGLPKPKKVTFTEGQEAEANYGGSKWEPCTIVEVSDTTIKVKWAYDSSEEEKPPEEVRAKEKVVVPTCRLVLYGEAFRRMQLEVKVLTAVDKKVPGFIDEHRPKTSEESDNESGYALVAHGFDVNNKGRLIGKLGVVRKKIEAICGGKVEYVGAFAYIVGKKPERNATKALIDVLGPSTSRMKDALEDELSDDLKAICSRLAVPQTAKDTVAGPKIFKDLEDATGTMLFWLPPGEEPPHLEILEELVVGMKVEGKFGRYGWNEASVLEVLPADEENDFTRVKVKWAYDDSEEEVLRSALRPHLEGEEAAERKKLDDLALSSPLAILGPEKPRKEMQLKLMGVIEEACPGTFSADDCASSSDGLKTETMSLTPEEAERSKDWAVAERRKTVGTASECLIEQVGAILCFAGEAEEISRARDYCGWLLSKDPSCDAELRDDVTCYNVPKDKKANLTSDVLSKVESYFGTFIFFDDGASVEGAEGHDRLVVCGNTAAKRLEAIEEIKAKQEEESWSAGSGGGGGGGGGGEWGGNAKIEDFMNDKSTAWSGSGGGTGSSWGSKDDGKSQSWGGGGGEGGGGGQSWGAKSDDRGGGGGDKWGQSDQPPADKWGGGGDKKVGMCNDFGRGNCNRGDRCKFSHGDAGGGGDKWDSGGGGGDKWSQKDPPKAEKWDSGGDKWPAPSGGDKWGGGGGGEKRGWEAASSESKPWEQDKRPKWDAGGGGQQDDKWGQQQPQRESSSAWGSEAQVQEPQAHEPQAQEPQEPSRYNHQGQEQQQQQQQQQHQPQAPTGGRPLPVPNRNQPFVPSAGGMRPSLGPFAGQPAPSGNSGALYGAGAYTRGANPGAAAVAPSPSMSPPVYDPPSAKAGPTSAVQYAAPPPQQQCVATNPRLKLKQLGAWPQNIGEWRRVQDFVWEPGGHPPLPPGWVRVWSRSRDTEYYTNEHDMSTTFSFEECR